MKSLSIKLLAAISCFAIGVTGFAASFLQSPIPPVDSPKILIDDRYADGPSPFHTSSVREWEKEVLGRFKEIPLNSLSTEAEECYRLVLLPTFARPLLVRVWRKDAGAFVATKRLSGDGGFGYKEMGKLSLIRERELTADEWKAFVASIESSEFWYLPTDDPRDRPVRDGEFWYLEGSRDGAKHKVGRITPKAGLRQTFEFLLDLSEMDSEYAGPEPWP
jgi:hypothetical protein